MLMNAPPHNESDTVFVSYWPFRIVISASMGADFPMLHRESALFSRGCQLSSLRVIPCYVTAKASAP